MISSQQLRYLQSSHVKRDLTHPNWKQLEEATAAVDALDEGHIGPQLSNAGISKPFLKGCEEAGVALVCTVFFTNEGDNITGSLQLVNQLNSVLGLVASTRKLFSPSFSLDFRC